MLTLCYTHCVSCCLNLIGGAKSTSLFQFCLTMFIFSLLTKCYLVYLSSKVFAAIGGAQAMESSQLSKDYDSLPGDDSEFSGEGSTGGGIAGSGGGYYPPTQSQMGLTDSIASLGSLEDARPVRSTLHMKPTPPHPPAAPLNGSATARNAQTVVADGKPSSADNPTSWTGTVSV